MAYQIKSIRYQNNPRKILLQNENGPCPLLAAANALLLRGVISLPSACIRNGVASTEDVVNMLANRALFPDNNSDCNNSPNKSHREYHLNEVLSILPTLQHGMDVNPKFTSPPSSSQGCVEYTHNLAAFDMLGVELVHGWLLDPQDAETYSVLENKSYNELIELVILGNEMKNKEVGMLIELIERKEKELLSLIHNINHGGGDEKDNCDGKGESCEAQTTTVADNITETSTPDVIKKDIADIRRKLEEASLQISRADVANAFLTSTSHQLTYHGLEQLHKNIDDDALHVFFRNNHFATLTKHNGVLYLLVTDLGYANTPEIIWEKLDSIDGNTEYVNEFFERPNPRAELAPAAGPTIDPALLLAQRSQTENDYQLAMAISRGDVNSSSRHNNNNTDEEEGKLIAAAKELSLRTSHGETNATVAIGNNNLSITSASVGSNDQMESDHQMALAYQRQEEQLDHESEQLARQLQELDRREKEMQRQRNNSNRRRHNNAPSRPAEKASCTIS
jgi:hypothetical protein